MDTTPHKKRIVAYDKGLIKSNPNVYESRDENKKSLTPLPNDDPLLTKMMDLVKTTHKKELKKLLP